MKLINGNCSIELENLISEGIKVDAIITDIPYFNIVENNWDNQWKSVNEYLQFISSIIKKFKEILNESGSIIMFTGRQYNRYIACELDKSFKEQRIIIWSRKRNFNNSRGKALASGYEPICYYTNSDNFVFNNLKIKVNSKRKEYSEGILKNGISLSDVWNDISALPHNSKEKVNHPTQKPIKLMERCVELCTLENQIVLDPFMGSGSTGVACKNLNRNFIGIELDKEYFKIAKERINGTS